MKATLILFTLLALCFADSTAPEETEEEGWDVDTQSTINIVCICALVGVIILLIAIFTILGIVKSARNKKHGKSSYQGI